MQEFLASNPSLTEIRSEILHYATFEQEIEDLKPIVTVGPIELNTGMRFVSLCLMSSGINSGDPFVTEVQVVK